MVLTDMLNERFNEHRTTFGSSGVIAVNTGVEKNYNQK